MLRIHNISAALLFTTLVFGTVACSQPEAPSTTQSEHSEAPLGARFVPVIEAGTVSGLNVHEVAAEGTAAELGLRDGDHITEVAGRAVTSAEHATEFLEQLAEGERPELVVERDGQRVVLRAGARG